MNCLDITHIANTGSFARLSEEERDAAAAHAATCRHCAPIWAAHRGLAQLRVPPIPTELAVRVRTLAALPARDSGGRGRRRLTVIGSLVALAAAAGALSLYRDHMRPAEPPAATAVVVTTPVRIPATVPVPEPTAADQPAPVIRTPAVMIQTKPLPLLPAPVYNEVARTQIMDLALQKLVERHPELVIGPATEGRFIGAIALYEDGRVLTSTVRQAPDFSASRDISAEVNRTVPTDAGNQYNSTFRKDTRLADGRTLRADLSARVIPLGSNYDPARSSLRVLQAIGDRYNHLMLPGSAGAMNRLTVFMTEDGQIQREHVERVGPPSGRTISAGNPGDVAFLAESIAKPLGLDIQQIGLIGTTTVEEGSLQMVADGNGDFRPDDQRQLLMVTYAWPRRAGESGPAWGQARAASQESAGAAIDKAAALAIVEREIPDAFRITDPAAGTPTVVLSARGELIKAGRIQMKSGPIAQTLRELLAPGVVTSSFSTVRVTNGKGESTDVMFAWEAPQRASDR